MFRRVVLKKRASIVAIAFVGLSLGLHPIANSESEVITSSVSVVSSGPIQFVTISNNPIQPGEFFKFILKYEFIGAGFATLEVREEQPVDGRPTLGLISHAKSNKMVDVFFKVRDFNASRVDRTSLTTLGFHQNLREGHYHVMRNTWIDYDKKNYTYERIYKGKRTIQTGPVNEAASDILSAFFYARTLPLKPGESYFIRVFSDGTVYPLRVDVDKKIHSVRVPAGRFKCIRVQPFVLGDAIFKAKEGRMHIWLTNDEHRMPVLIRSKVFIGAFDAELQEYMLPEGK